MIMPHGRNLSRDTIRLLVLQHVIHGPGQLPHFFENDNYSTDELVQEAHVAWDRQEAPTTPKSGCPAKSKRYDLAKLLAARLLTMRRTLLVRDMWQLLFMLLPPRTT